MQLKDILNKNGFRFNKRFGQNFLTDPVLLDDIVAKSGITENDTVVEVGCGGGTLTAAIAKKAKRVIGFEIDTNLKPVLAETLAGFDNVEIIFKDVMKTGTEEIEKICGEEFSVVANIPYYITTPILMKFVEESEKVKSITVTIEAEVADRLTAKPGTEDYGAITAGIDLVGNAEQLFFIDRKKFYPAPNVDSAVVKITMDRNKYPGADKKAYRAVVRCAFASRRKTLANNLMQSFKIPREEANEIICAVTDNPLARGETFSTEDFVALAAELKKHNIKF